MTFALVSDSVFGRHRSFDHVERPERLEAVEGALRGVSWTSELVRLAPREAEDHELLLCHDEAVLSRVKDLTDQGGGWLDPDTYVNEWSDRAARLAVGGGIDLCKAVLEGDYQRGFLAARPPGHHATPSRSMGFCLYSTAAIAAKACALLGKRVLVYDWDVHHGNGTQDCLYDHGGTCFVSLHQSPFYPGSGYPDERGVGAGEGLTYNVPLPAGCGDAEYLESYRSIVRPVIKQYDPHLIIVSAGYDAHHKDLLGQMKVTRDGFGQLAALVAEDAQDTAAQGRVVGFLEGGYHLAGLAESVVATFQAWLGHSLTPAPVRPVDDRVKRLLALLKQKYKL